MSAPALLTSSESVQCLARTDERSPELVVAEPRHVALNDYCNFYIDICLWYGYIGAILLFVRDVAGDVDLTERERFLKCSGSSLLLSGGLGIDPSGA